MFRWFKELFSGNSVDFRMERFLSQSADHAELEHRIRRWENMNEGEKNRW